MLLRRLVLQLLSVLAVIIVGVVVANSAGDATPGVSSATPAAVFQTRHDDDYKSLSSSGALTTTNMATTGLVATLAAGLGGLLALQWSTNRQLQQDRDFYRRSSGDSNDQRYQQFYGHHDHSNRATTTVATFLENGRTRVPQNDEDLSEAIAQGWSMAEALEAAQKDAAKTANMTPREVLQRLQRGNMRFYSGCASRPEKSAFHRRALISHQFPSTAVLGCSDSRVPVEIVFDQGLGDMFVVRVAGNCLGLTTRASLEYAVHHLNIKVLMVMGHEGCGAIKAAGLPLDKINQEPEALALLLKDIKSVLEKSTHLSKILDARARDREAVAANVAKQVAELAADPEIMAKVEAGKLKIVGAFYEISSGIVDFFHLVAQEVPGKPFKPSPGVHSRYNPKTKEVVYA